MPLSVLTAATSLRLTTLETVKAALHVTGVEQDAYLLRQIDVASARIADFVGQPLGQETVEETFHLPAPTPLLILTRRWATDIASVTANGQVQQESDWTLEAAAGLLRRASVSACWPAGTATVAYTTGWTLPGADERDLPAELEEAAIELVRRAWLSRDRDPGIRSETIQDVGAWSYLDVDRSVGVSGLPVDVERGLVRYRTVALR